MSRITLIDPQTAGISGDMLLGALVDLGAELKAIEQVVDLIPRHFPRCDSISLDTKEVIRHGFRSCGVEFRISEKSDESDASELVDAAQGISDSSSLSKEAKSFAAGSIRTLTEVESKLHGAEVSHVHLHEAGSADTLGDVFGVAAACDLLHIFESDIYSTPVAVGGGSIRFSHGTVSVPAPAVLEIVRQYGIPIKGGPVSEELATPTGVAMLANLTPKFLDGYPSMVPDRVGYGAGRKEFAEVPNLIRCILGRTEEESLVSETVQVLETNIDDVSGEILGHALQRVLESGAKDAWVTSAQFKKNRPGHVLHVICTSNDARKIAETIMAETGTLGVRYQEWNRFVLQRETVTVEVTFDNKRFNVRVKVAKDKSGRVVNIKPEFEDVQSIARSLSRPTREISSLILQEANRLK